MCNRARAKKTVINFKIFSNSILHTHTPLSQDSACRPRVAATKLPLNIEEKNKKIKGDKKIAMPNYKII